MPIALRFAILDSSVLLCLLFAVIQITYKGSGNVRNTQVLISWPYELQSIYASGKHLLYLTQLPQASNITRYQRGVA